MFKLLLVTCLMITSTSFAVDKVKVDLTQSKIVYLAKKVTGSHTGELKLSNGYLNFNKDELVSGEFTADMTSITNTDITDGNYHKKFLDHIIGDDFFAVDKYKTAQFVITNVKKQKADHYLITGDLTIKGKTSSVTFTGVVKKTKATATLTFDRTKFDIKYGSGKFFQDLGDKMIYDDVQLDVTLTLK